MNYYNENDSYAAEWLRNLITAGMIPDGQVDNRSIADVQPGDLKGFTQCHFFAGIAGWPLALALAGWPEDRPVWTGSCPCQPFSVAGKNKGVADERHLWPVFRNLIAECKPPAVFGEQVASRAGREWLCGVRANLETLGYAVGAADLCAAGVGAPHIRQRLFWVADAGYIERGQRGCTRGTEGRNFLQPGDREEGSIVAGECGGAGGVADPDEQGESWRGVRGPGEGFGAAEERAPDQPERRGEDCRLVNPIKPGLEGLAGNGCDRDQPGRNHAQQDRPTAAPGGYDFWADVTFVECLDGKTRRTEPGVSPLAYGVPGKVGKLRAYGNAIVPQVAARFIEAYLGAEVAA